MKTLINSVNCHISKKSEYRDYYLEPIVLENHHRNKSSSDFLGKLKPIADVPENSYLAPLDVRSLYTSISNSSGKKAGKISHENFKKKTTATKVIICSHSNFKQFYIQLKTLSTNQRL